MTGQRPLRALACALGLLAPLGAVGRADAQDRPLVEPAAEAGGPVDPLAGLAMNASLGGGWDSNAAFQTEGQQSASAFGEAGLVRTWRTPSWTFGAQAGAGGSVYRTEVATSRYRYGAGLSAAGPVGRQTDLSFGADANVAYTDYLTAPATAGLELPLSLSKRVEGTVGLGRRLGTKTRLDLNAGYGRYYFDAEDLVNGDGISAGAALSRTLSPHSALRLAYGFQSNQYDTGTRSRIDTVAGGFSRALSEHLTMGASLGADGRSAEGSEVRWTLNAMGTLGYEADLSSWTALYRRSVSPGPGIGTDRIFNLFRLVYASMPRPWLTVSVAGSHGINQDPVDQDVSYSTDTIDLSLRWRLSPTLGLAPRLRYRRRGEVNDLPAVSSFSAGVALDYSRFLR